jgi:hypothetical protein
MNLPPAAWGPFFWHTMHIIALGYPKNPTYTDKKAAKEFYESLQHLIPCPVCRTHYQKHLADIPLTPHLDSRTDLFKWTIDIHNRVNTDLGKPLFTAKQSVDYYKRLGQINRSPVWTPDDFAAFELKSLSTGLAIGITGTLAVGAAVYYLAKP